MFWLNALLSFPVKDNLFLEVDQQHIELKNLLKEFGLSDINLDKEIGLSGGQEKRVLFIRTLIHSYRYMVLDEPSSASDPDCENLIFKHLETKKGYLLVTHNISKLKTVSRIIVIKEGRVVSDESWSDVSGKEGLFRELLERERTLHDKCQ